MESNVSYKTAITALICAVVLALFLIEVVNPQLLNDVDLSCLNTKTC